MRLSFTYLPLIISSEVEETSIFVRWVKGWRYFLWIALLFVSTNIVARAAETSDKSESLTTWEAAAQGNLVALQSALYGVKVDALDGSGRTALMAAAAHGQFECAKELLWSGADPLLADPQGKMALDYLDPSSPSYLVNNLLLRGYALVRAEGRISSKPIIPDLVLVNDNYVDFTNPDIKPHYYVNNRELKGAAGRDDDANGFVDDVYGWRIEEDAPIDPGNLSLANTEEEKKFALQLLGRLEAASGSETSQNALRKVLSESYRNPLVRRIGFDTLQDANLKFNDLRYSEMLMGASHGTHVAGIILKNSGRKARLHCLSIGKLGSPELSPLERDEELRDLAFQSATFTEYVDRLLDRVRNYSLKKGRRCSDYIKQLSPGTVNLSWGLSRSHFEKSSEKVEETYRQYGQNPKSILTFQGPTSRSSSTDLGLELMACNAAAFALICYENPNVLIVISAGNNGSDNDVNVSSPQYFSRFFPNVLTVASHNPDGELSSFSNYGMKSVQIAAPGEKIASTMLYGATGFMSGTSMAAPAVAGAAALIRVDYPNLRATDVRNILEVTASNRAGLGSKIASGCLDKELALRVAREWPRTAPKVAELEAELRSVPANGVPAVSNHAAERVDRDPFIAVDELKSEWKISAFGGFGNSWRVAVSPRAEGERQFVCAPAAFPSAAISERRNQGFGIAAIAGEVGAWSVLLSNKVPSQQTMIGLSLDLPAIEERWKTGLKVRSLAGWKNQWIVVMDQGTGWGDQIIVPQAILDESKKQMLAKKRAEGFFVTSIAGDDSPEDQDDGWAFVLTKNTSYTEQVVSDPGEWPEEWIEEKNAEGFRITGTTGCGDRWVVVMSKLVGELSREIVGPGDAFPAEWLRTITSVPK